MNNDRLVIETTVTFPDGTHHSMKVAISQELYLRAEVPGIIEDVMSRGARAINQKIKEYEA